MSQEHHYRQAAASYIADMLIQLRELANTAGLPQLGASIDAAYYHAYESADGRVQRKGRRQVIRA